MSEEKKELEEEVTVKAQLDELEEKIGFLQTVYDTTAISMIQFVYEKGSATIISANNAAYMLTKYSKAEFAKKLNNDLMQLIVEEDREKLLDTLNELTVNGKPEKLNLRIKSYEKQEIVVDLSVACQVSLSGKTIFQAEFFDITPYVQKEKEQKEQFEKQLKEQSEKSKEASDNADTLRNFDSVTDLYTYQGFLEKCKELMAEQKENTCQGILCTDINNFLRINEEFDPQKGDEFLKDFATQLSKQDVFVVGARRYGCSFISVLTAKDKAELTAKIKDFTKEYVVEQRKNYPAADLYLSNGLYIVKKEDEMADEAIQKAWYAKEQVRGKKGVVCSVYSDLLHAQRMQEDELVEKVLKQLDAEHIEVYLQPKFNTQNGRMLGAEAFAAWKDEEGNSHSAAEFIRALESIGKSDIVDYAVYEKICQDMQRWHGMGKEIMPISINFTKNHAYEEEFVSRINKIAEQYHVDKSMIEMEFPEQAFVEAGEPLYEKLEQLREQGFMIHMDNFGGEFSSMEALLMAPVDTVKLSMGLISSAVDSNKNFTYLKRMCNAILHLDMDIIFRGVETKEQSDMLLELGCAGRAQGYFYSEPMNVADFEQKYLHEEKKVGGIFNIVHT